MSRSNVVGGWKDDVGDVTGVALVSTTSWPSWRLNVVLCNKCDVPSIVSACYRALPPGAGFTARPLAGWLTVLLLDPYRH